MSKGLRLSGRWAPIWLCLAGSQVAAHGDAEGARSWELGDSRLGLSAGLASTWRSDGWPEDRWYQVPGLLMGGHAEPVEEGFSLDEASVMMTWQHSSGVLAGFELASHGDSGVELEQAWLGVMIHSPESGELDLRAGRLKAAFSPEVGTHPSTRPFSENALLYDAFYGGHWVDEGVRLSWRRQTVQAGLELWNGGNFPATPGTGGGAQDLYLNWSPSPGQLARITVGGWLFRARADSRGDDRLDSDHTHGGSVLAPDALATVRFDGSHLGGGLWGEVAHGNPELSLWSLRAEWQRVEVDGTIRDDTRQSDLNGHYQGWSIQPEWRWQRHRVTARYSRLVLDNHLTGAGGPTLAANAGLETDGRNPWKAGISYGYAWEGGLGLRLEWTRQALVPEAVSYIGVGVTWSTRALN